MARTFSARRGTIALCGLALIAGIIIGSTAEWWSLSPARAAALDADAVNELYNELRSGNSPLLASSEQLAKIARLTTPSVVHIQSERRTTRGTVEETGSGVVMVSEKAAGYYIVTNRHVVDRTELKNISIHLQDGRVLHPTRIWTDPATDVAAMKISATDLTPARWGDSQKLDIGHIVLAMGSPFGLSQSITLGILSAKGRRALELGSGREVLNQDFLQTDAAINPGNSGGPLINLKGEVVGINTAIASNSGGNEGIGFSIPSNLARQVVEQLLEFGKVTRAYLGVKLDDEFNADAAARLKLDRVRGARVLQVYPNSPAARGKIQFDDVILYFDGIEIVDENHLINLVSLMPIEKEVKLIVMRGGKRMTLNIVLADYEELRQRARIDSEPGMGTDVKTLGLTVHELGPEIAEQLGFPRSTSGLLVLKVDPTSPVAGQVQLYDLIEEVARTPMNTVQDLEEVLGEVSTDSLLLKIQRKSGGREESHLIVVPR